MRPICSKCKVKPCKITGKFKSGALKYKKLCWSCDQDNRCTKLEHNDHIKEYRKNLKIDVVSHYGGKCICCGEDELAFLTIDHTNGGGNTHRKSIRMRGGSDFYLWLRKNKYPKNYQVLCFNCNWAKFTNGICPHQIEA